VDRRRLVLLTTVGQLLCAAGLAGLAVAGPASVWPLLVLVVLQTTCTALGAPARRTFPPRLLPPDEVSAGVALNHLGFQAALLLGPALAGVVMGGWGVGACYLLDTVSFAAALYGVRGLPPLPAGDGTGRPGFGAIWQGWRFIGGRPVLLGAFLTDALATVTAMPVALFPVVNAERFGGHPQTLGLLLSAIAVGGIVAGAGSGIVTRSARPGLAMLVAAGVWGLGLAGFGLAQQLWPALGALAVAGAADTLSVIARGSIIQLATPDSHRGRVSAVELAVGVSGPDLGNFRGGLVAGATSATFALVSGGLLCTLGVAVVGITNGSLRRVAGRRAAPTGQEVGPPVSGGPPPQPPQTGAGSGS
jgi:predicted MFS family arabinose efflux permease